VIWQTPNMYEDGRKMLVCRTEHDMKMASQHTNIRLILNIST